MITPEEFTHAEARVMGAFRESALSLEDVLEDQEILECVERGEDVTVENE